MTRYCFSITAKLNLGKILKFFYMFSQPIKAQKIKSDFEVVVFFQYEY